MLCEQIRAALTEMAGCAPSEQGVSFATHCMYPSFEPVRIHVSRTPSGYHVHDGGGALHAAWDHGRDTASARRAVGRYAAMHDLLNVDGQLAVNVSSSEWLLPAILSVANVSAAAAADIVDAPAERQTALIGLVEAIIRRVVDPSRYVRDYEVRGRSGKIHRFDFGVQDAGRHWLLVETVVAHPASVSAKYVAFSDTRDADRTGLAVYDTLLDEEDSALLKQVADLVPLARLDTGLRAEIT